MVDYEVRGLGSEGGLTFLFSWLGHGAGGPLLGVAFVGAARRSPWPCRRAAQTKATETALVGESGRETVLVEVTHAKRFDSYDYSKCRRCCS